MLNQKDILLTQDMIDKRHLDIRTITMGISLLDCCDPDLKVCCEKIYKKITRCARDLVQVGEDIEKEFGIPIVNKRISVTPIALVGAACQCDSYVEIAKTLDAAAKAGVPMLFTGSAAELTARTIAKTDGKTIECLGLTDCDAVRSTGRELGDVLYASKLSEKLLAGFINKSGWLKNVASPLFTAEFGPGGIVDEKGEVIAAEGIRTGSVTATYAIGPILARNPWLKRLYAADILQRKTGSADVSAIADDASDKGYEITVRELLKRK